MRRPAALLAALTAAALTLLAPPAHAAQTPHPQQTSPTRLYTPPANPDAYRQIRLLAQQGAHRDAAGVLAMIRTPQAVWYGDQTPAEVQAQVRTTVRDAARERALPVLALYNIPGRDCSQYSAGGAANTAEYQDWIDAVARGIGRRDALVILEPDSLALLPSDCGQDDSEGTLTAARYAQTGYAVHTLEPLAGTRVYLDTGHPAWHSVNSIVPRLIHGGIADATGFFTNVSNYRTDDDNAWYGRLISSCLAYAAAGGDPAACPNQWWPRADAQSWLDANVHTSPAAMKHFVTDTSRNGQGPWTPPAGTYTDPQDWCNPPARGLGARPGTRTGDPLQDARLWVKIPGESDGLCLRGTDGPQDPERGTADPAAGDWFPDMALELVRNADPAILP